MVPLWWARAAAGQALQDHVRFRVTMKAGGIPGGPRKRVALASPQLVMLHVVGHPPLNILLPPREWNVALSLLPPHSFT